MLSRLLPDRQGAALGLSLAAIVGVAWIYVVRMSLDLTAIGFTAAGSQPHAHHVAPSVLEHAAMLFVMWVVMMAAMMLPAALPVLAIHARFRRSRVPGSSATVPTLLFALGYVLAWTGFSAAASGAQVALEAQALASPTMGELHSRSLAGLVMVLAGVFQLTPVKNACLTRCRTPLGFLMTSWREGPRGAVVMGVHYGLYCVACCWALMALLFVAGVMNLLWMAAITVFMALEKLLSRGPSVARIGGVALIVGGLALVASDLVR